MRVCEGNRNSPVRASKTDARLFRISPTVESEYFLLEKALHVGYYFRGAATVSGWGLPDEKEINMAAYGKKSQSKVKKAMEERKKGTLRSGKSGKKVTSRKQAIAIGLSEARKAGAKVPRKRKS